MFYLYKDTFLSGWGMALRGSYVISDIPIKRSEFKLLGTSEDWDDFKFGSGKDRHFCFWKHTGEDFAVKWVSQNKPLEIGKVRQTWNYELLAEVEK